MPPGPPSIIPTEPADARTPSPWTHVPTWPVDRPDEAHKFGEFDRDGHGVRARTDVGTSDGRVSGGDDAARERGGGARRRRAAACARFVARRCDAGDNADGDNADADLRIESMDEVFAGLHAKGAASEQIDLLHNPFEPIRGISSDEWRELIAAGATEPDLLDVPLSGLGVASDGDGGYAARIDEQSSSASGSASGSAYASGDDAPGGDGGDGGACAARRRGAMQPRSADGAALQRGKYRCRMCGQYKANHVCPFVVDRTRRTTAQQTEPVYVPRITLEGAVTITVRPRRN